MNLNLSKKKIIIISLIIIICVAEAHLRIHYKEELKDRIYPKMWCPDPLYGYNYIPKYKGVMSTPGIQGKEITINRHGYIGPDFTRKKKRGVYRIIVVGSSVAGGIWSNGTVNYATFLEQLFRRRGYQVEVINCSTDGEGRGKRNIDLINRELWDYDPDLVLLETVFPLSYKRVNREIYRGYKVEYLLNSTTSRSKVIKQIDVIERYSFLTWPHKYSYVIRAMCKFYFEKYADMEVSDLYYAFLTKTVRFRWETYYYSVDGSIALLKTAQRTLSRKNARLVLLEYGIDEDKKAIFIKNHLPVIYLTHKLDATCLSLPDSHPNRKGHQTIANWLFRPLVGIYLNERSNQLNSLP